MIGQIGAARFLTGVDSSVNGVRALGKLLRGREHKPLSTTQGLPLDRVRQLDVDELDQWTTGQYGPGPYPVVVVGSASGALIHLAAALGAPFLPQTTLCSVRDLATHPDDPAGAMAALAPTLQLVARNNPRVSVYQMHDPAQDRPMLAAMAYLRLKRRALGRPYERFLEERLAPGGTILQVECTRDWPVRQVGERAYFQFGCLGGISEQEYHQPGERIANYLAQVRSPERTWRPPETPQRQPEAEWGWDPALAPEVTALAGRYGYQLRRLVCSEPQEHSPFVADLHRWWYRQRGRPADRLLVESDVHVDPLWVLRTGSVPFWIRFNLEPSYRELTDYLEASEPYEVIYLDRFSRGIKSPGMVPVERWERLLRRHARQRGEDQRAGKSVPDRHPLPQPLTVEQVDQFARHAGTRYPVTWAVAG